VPGYPGGMRLLAIDTAFDACSVGFADGARLVTRSIDAGRSHAEHLLGMIRDVTSEAGVALADLDCLAVTTGPGSFTGIRIGVAAVRGLALVTRTPTIGVTTLAVHAEEARTTFGGRPVLTTIAAGRGELYGALFSDDGAEIEPPAAASAQVFAAMVTPDTVIAGSGVDLVLAALPMAPRVTVAHRRASPSIAALCALALRTPPSPAPLRPLYLRPPDARPQTGAAVARR
jgi:tRNA threonylcarbamoyladenosine biosynthesis protein TsaB